jgi:hypothetical protein
MPWHMPNRFVQMLYRLSWVQAEGLKFWQTAGWDDDWYDDDWYFDAGTHSGN